MVEEEKTPKRKAVSWKNKFIAKEEEFRRFKEGLETEEVEFEEEEDISGEGVEEEEEIFKCPKCRSEINKFCSVCPNCENRLVWEE